MVSDPKPAFGVIRINLSKGMDIYILNFNGELSPSLSSSSTLLWIYFLVALGVALQVGAANWDIIWHGVVNVESFFTPPHTVLYSGVGLSLIATVAGIVISIKQKRLPKELLCNISQNSTSIKTNCLGMSCGIVLRPI